MRLALPALLFVSLIVMACATTDDGSVQVNTPQDGPAMTDTAGVYRHIVAFQFKEEATDAQIDQIVEDFGKLQDDIPEIIAFEHGKQVSPEGFDQGYTHVFIVTFKDSAGLEIYLPHPAHKTFVAKLLPLLDPPPFVVDYVAQ